MDIKKNRLFIPLLLFTLMYTLFIPDTGFPLITLSLPKYEILLDSTITVPITLESNDPEGICVWDLAFHYDPNILQPECDPNIPGKVIVYRDLCLTKDYKYVLAFEHALSPGTINVCGIAELDNDDPIPTKGTGILFKMKLISKRVYPRSTIRSSLWLTFKDIEANDLRDAICEQGEIKILPSITSAITINPSSGAFDRDTLCTIIGQGLQQGSISVIGPHRISDAVYSNGTITALVPANSLPPGLSFDVIITNPDGNFAVITDGFGTDHHFEAGLNLFGYPTIPPEGCDGSQELISHLAQTAGDAVCCLMTRDPNTLWWNKTWWENNEVKGADFPLNTLQAILVYINENGLSRSFPGYLHDKGIQTQIEDLAKQIKPGLNLVSLCPPLDEPIDSHGLTKRLSEKIGDHVSLCRMQPAKAQWRSIVHLFGRPSGLQFRILNTEGYLLYSPQP